jgi:iron complex outermembrane receptor protein
VSVNLLKRKIVQRDHAVRLILVLLLSGNLSVPGLAQNSTPSDLTQVSLEDLMNMQVTSVSKKGQNLKKTGAAVFVINQEDIRRSGVTNIPDLLRMAPGVDVARIDANTWAISIRGFNYRYSSRVLVLIDGRTVYTPTFSGVFWDEQDVPLEDIDRIEVIRGPGGTVWGANAVNGVINIITKSSKDTQGGLVTAGTGSEQSADGLFQYGGKAGQKGHYRVFGRYFNVENSARAGGGPAADGWHGSHGGFRSDWNPSDRDAVTVQGDLFGTSEGQTVTTLFSNQLPDFRTLNDKVTVGSGNVLGRWNHTFSNGSETSMQVYYDRVSRFDQGATDVLNTGDADFQYHVHAGRRHDIVAGAGYRLTDHDYRGGYAIAFGTGHRLDKLLNTFIQDEVSLTNSLALTLGSKFEHNSYTGLEYEPSAQLVWTATGRQTLWASAARAIRQPSWFDTESQFDLATFPQEGGGFGVLHAMGTKHTETERLLDFEIGYRNEVSKRVSLDVTAFRSHHDDIQTLEPGIPYFTSNPAPPHIVFPSYWSNLGLADNYGIEMFANWNVTNRWRISPGFTYLQMKIAFEPSSRDTTTAMSVGDSPKHQAQLRSTVNLRHNVEWDASAYFVGSLRIGPVPSYTRLDTRLGWRIGESVELSITGQNLLSPHHLEFADANQVNPTQADRSVFGKITWRF